MKSTMTSHPLWARVSLTVIVVVAACLLGWWAWQHYRYAPWTRDARIQADVVNVAPEVSGTVVALEVKENQLVDKGDVLFRIDPRRFKHALAQAKAQVKSSREHMVLARNQAARRRKLGRNEISREKLQQAGTKAAAAQADYASAKATLAQAELNLQWASVRAPVTGYVTHLQLAKGDYINRGQAAITLVDSQSFHVVAYFEETKLASIHVGDQAQIRLMADWPTLTGHIDSISHGIAVANNRTGERHLPEVNPTFEWVHLAQRVPVRIALDNIPDNVQLSIGMSCTVTVRP